MNHTEIWCTVNVTDLPPPIVGEKSLLGLELVPTDYNFVSNWSQLLVFVERIGAGKYASCLHSLILTIVMIVCAKY